MYNPFTALERWYTSLKEPWHGLLFFLMGCSWITPMPLIDKWFPPYGWTYLIRILLAILVIMGGTILIVRIFKLANKLKKQ